MVLPLHIVVALVLASPVESGPGPAPAPAPAEVEPAEVGRDGPPVEAAESLDRRAANNGWGETAAERAQRHFQAQEWDEAVEALIEAYAEDPDPAYLYARAQAERQRGNCRAALALYRRFLQSDPSPKQRADTERHIRLCEELEFQEEVSQPVSPAPAESPPPQRDTAPRRDVLAPVLLASGLLAAGGGITMAILGGNARRAAPGSSTESAYETNRRRGTILLATGLTLTSVGIGLLAGALARFWSVSKQRRASTGPSMTMGAGRSLGWTLRARF